MLTASLTSLRGRILMIKLQLSLTALRAHNPSAANPDRHSSACLHNSLPACLPACCAVRWSTSHGCRLHEAQYPTMQGCCAVALTCLTRCCLVCQDQRARLSAASAAELALSCFHGLNWWEFSSYYATVNLEYNISMKSSYCSGG
jgi:hypothetical protein